MLEFPDGSDRLYAFYRHDARVQRCLTMARKSMMTLKSPYLRVIVCYEC